MINSVNRAVLNKKRGKVNAAGQGKTLQSQHYLQAKIKSTGR